VRRDVILDLTPPPQVVVRPRFPWGRTATKRKDTQ